MHLDDDDAESSCFSDYELLLKQPEEVLDMEQLDSADGLCNKVNEPFKPENQPQFAHVDQVEARLLQPVLPAASASNDPLCYGPDELQSIGLPVAMLAQQEQSGQLSFDDFEDLKTQDFNQLMDYCLSLWAFDGQQTEMLEQQNEGQL